MKCSACGANAFEDSSEAPGLTPNERTLAIRILYCQKCDWVTVTDWSWLSWADEQERAELLAQDDYDHARS